MRGRRLFFLEKNTEEEEDRIVVMAVGNALEEVERAWTVRSLAALERAEV